MGCGPECKSLIKRVVVDSGLVGLYLKCLLAEELFTIS